MEFQKSQKGGKILFYEGYRYRKDKESVKSTTWRCTVAGCKGRALAKNDQTVTIQTDHNHALNPAAVQVGKVKEQVKYMSKHSHNKPKVVLQSCTSNMSTEATVSLPTYDSIRKTVQRQRTSSNIGSTNTIDNDLKTDKGEPFILWDSENDSIDNTCRILILGTKNNLNLLLEFSHWCVDRTFDVAPQLSFAQLFTVHVLLEKKALPVVYVLLKNKQKQTYLKLWTKLLEIEPRLKPISVLLDFETACFTAITEVFP